MNRKTKLAVSAGAALAAVGAGGAIAATKLAPAESSKAVVDDAAKQLGIEPQKLKQAHGGGPGFGGRRHPGPALDVAASYLGMTEEKLRAALDGDASLADVAKDAGKSVDGLVGALVSAQTKELDAAVADGSLTKARRAEIVAKLEQRVTDRVNGVRTAFGGRRGLGFRGGHGPDDLARGA